MNLPVCNHRLEKLSKKTYTDTEYPSSLLFMGKLP